jgi:hypothetical protein
MATVAVFAREKVQPSPDFLKFQHVLLHRDDRSCQKICAGPVAGDFELDAAVTGLHQRAHFEQANSGGAIFRSSGVSAFASRHKAYNK